MIDGGAVLTMKDDLLSIIHECFNENFATDIEELYSHVEKKGLEEVNNLLQQENKLKPYIAALLYPRYKSINFNLLRDFLSEGRDRSRRVLTEKGKEVIIELLSGIRSFEAFINSATDGWNIMNGWFETNDNIPTKKRNTFATRTQLTFSTKAKQVRLSSHELNILELAICLCVREGCSTNLLFNIWGVCGLPTLKRRKTGLINKFIQGAAIAAASRSRPREPDDEQSPSSKSCGGKRRNTEKTPQSIRNLQTKSSSPLKRALDLIRTPLQTKDNMQPTAIRNLQNKPSSPLARALGLMRQAQSKRKGPNSSRRNNMRPAAAVQPYQTPSKFRWEPSTLSPTCSKNLFTDSPIQLDERTVATAAIVPAGLEERTVVAAATELEERTVTATATELEDATELEERTVAAAVPPPAQQLDHVLNLSKEKFPLLASVCKKTTELESLIKELAEFDSNKMLSVVLSRDNGKSKKKHASCFRVKRRNNKYATLIQVPGSSDYGRFVKTANDTQWLLNVINNASKSGIEVTGVVGWMIAYLSKRFPDALEWATTKLKLPFLKKPMDATTALAMFHDANVAIAGQRIIRRYFFVHCNFWITPPEARLRELTNNFVQPVVGKTKVVTKLKRNNGDVVEKPTNVPWYYTPIDVAILKLLEQWGAIDFSELHAVLGMDHGARVMTAAMKVIAFDEDGYVVADAVLMVGHIDCIKDTYDVVNETIGPLLNESIKELKGKTLRIRRSATETATRNAYFADGSDGVNHNYKNHKVVVLAIGDLAFQMMIQGRPNMSTNWCPYCDMMRKLWGQTGEKGRQWTNALIAEFRETIINTCLKGAARKGISPNHTSIWDAFEPWEYIIPLLHCMMGMFNDAINLIFQIVDRYENISEEEREAKKNYLRAVLNVTKKRSEGNQDDNAAQQAIIDSRIDELNTKIREKNPEQSEQFVMRKSKYSNAEKKVFRDEISILKKKKDDLKQHVDEFNEELLALKKTEREMLRTYKKVRKEVGYDDRTLRQKLEEVFIAHGIDRRAHHGGAFTGVDCLKLEQKVVEILQDIKSVCVNCSSQINRSEHDLDDLFESLKLHFLLLSRLFSLARTPKFIMKRPTTKAKILGELRDVIELVKLSTKRLHLSTKTPKFHIVCHHLAEMMDAHDGIAEYVEDWLEQAHQTQKQNVSRCNIRDLQKKANYGSRVDIIKNNYRIAAVTAHMRNANKRNFKDKERKESRPVKLKIERDSKRDNAVVRFKELYELQPNLKSLLEQDLALERDLVDAGINDGAVDVIEMLGNGVELDDFDDWDRDEELVSNRIFWQCN